MKLMLLTALMLLAAGCVTGISDSALCDGTDRMRDAHTAALLDDGGDRSVTTGAALIGAIDAACKGG